jgi:hypothetical protein
MAVRFFITSAAFDPVIWTPALPEALAMYTSEVASVHIDGGDMIIAYQPGAFGAQAEMSRAARVVPFAASGHSVSLDEPAKLASDVRAWLAER